MPWHIESDDSKSIGDRGIIQQVAELPPVASGGVQAKQSLPFPRFLKIKAVPLPADTDAQIAAGYGLYFGRKIAASVRLDLVRKVREEKL